ncbi:F0F1 ATP synthase subunit B [Candidatus Peregrinibacteria bacterium]|nr:F0F1 ATP synthase subunit B [Candidatus Peregrinibacteria bacterium]
MSTAYAADEGREAPESSGLSITPTTVAFQALNLLILLFILKKILYKPLMNLLHDREQTIKEGVENAKKADVMLQESDVMREEILGKAHAESLTIIEQTKKQSEELKARMMKNAEDESLKKIAAGEKILQMKEQENMEKLRKNAVNLVILAAEKVLQEKITTEKDMNLITQSVQKISL